MYKRQTRVIRTRKEAETVYQPELIPGWRQEFDRVTADAPQVAYRRAKVNGNGLTAADLLAMQRTVDNRQVQRALVRRGDTINNQ